MEEIIALLILTRCVSKHKEKPMNRKQIARRLVGLRGNRTREETAKAVGISVSALGMYETGRRIPQDEIKIRFARYFGVTVQEIFFAD